MNLGWVNGQLVPLDRPQLSVFDRGFTLGDGLFETMRAYGGRVFRLQDHLERLARSATLIDLPIPSGLAAAVVETLNANGLEEAAIRLTISRGPAPPGLRPPGTPRPSCVITARPAPEPPDTLTAATASGRLNEHAPTAGLKRLGYLDALMALEEARAAGYDDAVLLDTSEHLAEGSASNLFLVERGGLRTAPLSCGVLPGITRAVVLELAAELGLAASTEPLERTALAAAEEAFLTSSLREVVPLTAVDGRPVGSGAPGPLTLRLRDAYRGRAREAT